MIGIDEPWSVCIAFVMFKDLPEGKRRPAVILQNDGKNCRILPITSKVKDEVHYYRLIHWEYANLDVPSFVKLNLIEIPTADIDKIIGKLAAEDIKNIMFEMAHGTSPFD